MDTRMSDARMTYLGPYGLAHVWSMRMTLIIVLRWGSRRICMKTLHVWAIHPHAPRAWLALPFLECYMHPYTWEYAVIHVGRR